MTSGLLLLGTVSLVSVILELEHLHLSSPFSAFQKLPSSSLGKEWRLGQDQTQEVPRRSKSPQGCPR